jgi:hypothetical protein
MKDDRRTPASGFRRSASMTAAALLVALLAGCAYKLEGKVIDGFGSVNVGRADDPDARRSGIAGATIELIRDVGTPNRATAGRATAGADGRFTLELQGFGAGWMDESWLLRVRRNGYENIEQEIQLPGSTDGRLLLVGMHRGRSAPFREPESSKGLMEETKQWYPGLGSGISGSP